MTFRDLTTFRRRSRARSGALALLALLLVVAQFIASAHRIAHADHASIPAGHNCLVFDAVLGGTTPTPTVVAAVAAAALPSTRVVDSVVASPDSPRSWAAFRPRDPPSHRVT
ncbi:hypothetical protein BH10PSE17_BH10PSE17_34700 [soil metagenome]